MANGLQKTVRRTAFRLFRGAAIEGPHRAVFEFTAEVALDTRLASQALRWRVAV